MKWMPGIHLREADFADGENAREHVVEVMGQAGGQVGQGCLPCGAEQPAFQQHLTRQMLLESRLLSSAWKTTLADLTPGLAHDFNNVLTGILAVSEVCLAQVDARHPFHEILSLIKQQVQEASQLVHRIARLHQEAPGCYDYQ